MKGAIGICTLLAGAALAMSLAVWNRAPDPMPIHWNLAGEPDDYGSKALGLLLIPGIIGTLPVLLMVITALDPRREHVERSLPAIGAIVAGTGAFFLMLHAMIVQAVMSQRMTLDTRLICTFLGVIFVLIGLTLPKLRSNWFAGIRTPWTLSSERVWHLTHRLGGWMSLAGGALLIVIPWLLQGTVLVAWTAVIIGLAVMGPVVYSYFCYRQERRAVSSNERGVS